MTLKEKEGTLAQKRKDTGNQCLSLSVLIIIMIIIIWLKSENNRDRP